MAMSRPPPPTPPSSRFNLEITIISGKHLKNVNWKNGDLKPYAIFWVNPDNKLTTKSDDSGNTKPVWNQRFNLPINSSLPDAFLSLEIFHSKASETPKPFVGSLQVRLATLPEFENPTLTRTFELLRPSGRAQGKIRLKFSIKEQLLPQSGGLEYNYQHTPDHGYYYSSAPPFPYSNSRSASPGPPPAYPYSTAGYYSGYYPPPSGARGYGAPSAPVEFNQYEQRMRPGAGFATGLGVGAIAGAIGGIALDEGLKYEEQKIAERVEDNYLSTPKDDFSDYRGEF